MTLPPVRQLHSPLDRDARGTGGAQLAGPLETVESGVRAAAWSPLGDTVAYTTGQLLVLTPAAGAGGTAGGGAVRLPVDCEADAVRWAGPAQLLVSVPRFEEVSGTRSGRL